MSQQSFLKIALWAVKLLLSVTLVWAGYKKLLVPETLPWPWIKEHPHLVPFTGVLDLLAGLGIVLPFLLNLQPKLTKYASLSIILLMLSAIVFHVSRGEVSQISFNVFVIVLAGFVFWKN